MNTLLNNNIRTLESELPDALDRLAEIMGSGKSLEQGIKIWTETHPWSPLGAEFHKITVSFNNGMPFHKALEMVKADTGSAALANALSELQAALRTGESMISALHRASDFASSKEQCRAEARTRDMTRVLTAAAVAMAAVALKRTF